MYLYIYRYRYRLYERGLDIRQLGLHTQKTGCIFSFLILVLIHLFPNILVLTAPRQIGELVSKFVSLKQASVEKRLWCSSPKDQTSLDGPLLHCKVVLTFKSSSFLWCPQSKGTQNTMLQDSNSSMDELNQL